MKTEHEEMRERLEDVETQLHEAFGCEDVTAAQAEQIAMLNAERCNLKSRMADKPAEQMGWAKREFDYMKSALAARDLEWTDVLASAAAQQHSQDALGEDFRRNVERLKAERGKLKLQ